MLRQCQAMEAAAAAAKFGVLRALIRVDDQPLPGGGYRGDLPEGWTKSLTHEVALALSMPAVSADRMMWLAWDLQARLPGVGALLAAGTLTAAKAKAVNEALESLSAQDAARAQELILPELTGKTFGQVVRIAVQAAVTVDPDSATRRREEAERSKSRVQMFREESGAAALTGRELPTDQTLAAHASVCARAQEYLDSDAFPPGTRMDQYRAAAYLDLLNEISAAARIATGQLTPASRLNGDAPGHDGSGDVPGPDGPRDGDVSDRGPGDRGPGDRGPGDRGPGNRGPGDRGPGDRGPGNAAAGDPGPGDDGPSHSGPGHRGPGRGDPLATPPRPVDLVVPLATLLGLGERPGESHGLGPLDPGLARQLAAAACASPGTRICVTVTDPDGIAIGHGCARAARANRGHPRGHPGHDRRPFRSITLPARLNLTIPAADLARLGRPPDVAHPVQAPGPPSAAGPPGAPGWSFTSRADAGPPGGYGCWTLDGPSQTRLTVRLEPVPAFACDHRHESHAYQPNEVLRHLVQLRDGDCTFPSCSRHARETDFEHAVPYHRGGRTCACNAGSRSRACHRVKQSPGWIVTQPVPGWHHWQGPSGRGYTQGPKRYPA